MNRSLASALLVAVAAASLGACSITRPSPVKEMYLLEPSHAVCARGLLERFEVDFPADAARE